MEIKKKLSGKIIKLQKKKNKCPTCKKNSTETFAPFCSKKCSDLDLMKWLSDENSINLN
tara:strand:+ start:427 stop:603 length:177 start_codon:yes stop_codon:yes gene_type:complete